MEKKDEYHTLILAECISVLLDSLIQGNHIIHFDKVFNLNKQLKTMIDDLKSSQGSR